MEWFARLLLVGSALLACAACSPSSPVVAPAVVVVAPAASAAPAVTASEGETPRLPGCTEANPIYVTVTRSVRNETGRPDAEIEGVVVSSLNRTLAQWPGVVLMPGPHVAGRCDVTLSAHVHAFEHSSGELVVRLNVAAAWRADGSLLGNVRKTLRKEGVPAEDRASEIELVGMAAELAAENFAASARAFTDPAPP